VYIPSDYIFSGFLFYASRNYHSKSMMNQTLFLSLDVGGAVEESVIETFGDI
jgi:hypothetical protein